MKQIIRYLVREGEWDGIGLGDDDHVLGPVRRLSDKENADRGFEPGTLYEIFVEKKI